MFVRNLLRKMTASSFKPFGPGYLLRTSHPWIFGQGATYVVTEAQKEALMTAIPVRHPVMVIVAILAFTVSLLPAMSILSPVAVRHLIPIDTHLITIGIGVLNYGLMVLIVRQRAARMAPILARAVRTS